MLSFGRAIACLGARRFGQIAGSLYDVMRMRLERRGRHWEALFHTILSQPVGICLGSRLHGLLGRACGLLRHIVHLSCEIQREFYLNA